MDLYQHVFPGLCRNLPSWSYLRPIEYSSRIELRFGSQHVTGREWGVECELRRAIHEALLSVYSAQRDHAGYCHLWPFAYLVGYDQAMLVILLCSDGFPE